MSPPVNEPVINVVCSVIYVFFFTICSFVVWGARPLRYKQDLDTKELKNTSNRVSFYIWNAGSMDYFTMLVQMLLAGWCIALIFVFGFKQSTIFNLPTDPESSYYVLAWIRTVWVGSLVTTIFYLINMLFKFFLDKQNEASDGKAGFVYTPVFGYGMQPLYKFYARPFLLDKDKTSEKEEVKQLLYDFNGNAVEVPRPVGARFNFSTAGTKGLRCLVFYLSYFGFLIMMCTFIGAVETNSIYPYPGRPSTSPWDSINVATAVLCIVGIFIHSALQSDKLYSFIHRGELYGDHCGRAAFFCLPIPAIIAYNFALFGAFLQFFNNVNPFIGAVLIAQVIPLFMAGWTGTMASWLDYHMVAVLALTHVFFLTTDLSVYNVPDSMGIAGGPFRYLEFWQDRNVTSGFYYPQDQMAIRYLMSVSGIVSAGFLILNVLYDMYYSSNENLQRVMRSFGNTRVDPSGKGN